MNRHEYLDEYTTLSIEPPFWGVLHYVKLTNYSSIFGWFSILLGAALWLLSASFITSSFEIFLKFSGGVFTGIAVQNSHPAVTILGLFILLFSIPLIRLIPWFFSPLVADMGVQKRDANRNFAIITGIVVSIYAIMRLIAIGILGDGFQGPQEITLPVTLVIYYFAVFSAMDLRLYT